MLKRTALVATVAAVFTACSGSGDAPPVKTSPISQVSPTAAPSPRFGSIAEALAFIDSNIGVPVALPSGLPTDARLATHPVYLTKNAHRVVSAQLHFVFGKKEYLVLQYGMATFDGCGGENAKPTRVGHHPAVMSAFGHWGEVIWPATMDHLQGRYGLSGTFFPRELIRLADSMAAALQSGGRSARISSGAADVGC